MVVVAARDAGGCSEVELGEWLRDTWWGLRSVVYPTSGLPGDYAEWGAQPAAQTSPTNIAFWLLGLVGARDCGLVANDQARSDLAQALGSLAQLERLHGFFYGWYDASSGERLKVWPGSGGRLAGFLSSVDNGWLAAALIVVAAAEPSLQPQAETLLSEMDFGFFYDEAAGHLHGGFRTSSKGFTQWHFTLLNTEARIVSYLGIARGQLPSEHYFKLFRTLPAEHRQSQVPEGDWRRYRVVGSDTEDGIEVFQGYYRDERGRNVVPSWGGSLFEALMPTLLVPEESWGARSWKLNHERYVSAQIEHGRRHHDGYWGFSPCYDPIRGYREAGVGCLGSHARGYGCGEARCRSGLISPHAVCLALRYAPAEASRLLRRVRDDHAAYGPLGFVDALRVPEGSLARRQLALDQGMTLVALANALGGDCLRGYFTRTVESAVRPLLEAESFFAQVE